MYYYLQMAATIPEYLQIMPELNRLALICLCFCGLIGARGLADTISFDNLAVGMPPPGWTACQTGKGLAIWTVVVDETAPSKPNVLKQSGVATYPVCIKEDSQLKDGFVEVKFKTVAGKEDRAAGVVWRCQDTNNYYVARANALEDNITIYHTINGKRTEKKRVELKVASDQWHLLRVDFEGSHFEVSFDGKMVLEWDDDTFKAPGRVGVWTKADSVTVFDDFRYGTK
jgi:hypothetical protein